MEDSGDAVELIELDSDDAEENADVAAEDPGAVAYLGEPRSYPSLLVAPLLNAAGLAQVSPTSTYVGLTRAEGAEEGHPEDLRPTGRPTFIRVIPGDHLLAAGMVRLLLADGVRRVLVAADDEAYGQSLSELFLARAGTDIEVVADGADALVYSGSVHDITEELMGEAGVPVYAFDGVADPDFLEDLPVEIASRLKVVTAAADPLESAASVLRRLPDRGRHTLYGYEAARLAIDAAVASEGDREGTLLRILATRDRDSVLGRYSIEPSGDTTLERVGVLTAPF